MKAPLVAALVMLAGLATVTAARADAPTLRQLLGSGFQIVGTDVIPSDVGKRMSGDNGWQDDLLITLQRGASVAFCHALLGATISNNSLLDVVCFEPTGTPPVVNVPSSEAPTSSSEAPSSEAPLSQMLPSDESASSSSAP